MLFGDEHVQVYRDTRGAIGHEWQPGVFTLLLTTKGRVSGDPHTTPLIYTEHDDGYVVIASKGGAAEHPDWYRNLDENPKVELQVGSDFIPATARTASGSERERLWGEMAEIWPDYDEYAKKTDREIPVVVLEPRP